MSIRNVFKDAGRVRPTDKIIDDEGDIDAAINLDGGIGQDNKGHHVVIADGRKYIESSSIEAILQSIDISIKLLLRHMEAQTDQEFTKQDIE